MNNAMRRYSIAVALAFTLAPVYAQQPLNPPLKNWPAPFYWAPTPREAEQQRIEQRIAHPDVSSSAIAQAASIFTPPGPMTFVAITPCRVMDTRTGQGFGGAFGPPSLAATPTAPPRVVPMPSSSCNIPSNAGAYSLNIGALPPGPLLFLAVWPAGQPYPGVATLGAPVAGGVIANAAIVVAGTSGAIQMIASNITDVIIDINGYYAVPSDLSLNTAIGFGALGNNTTGTNNTAFGAGALQANSTGLSNTASGVDALFNNTTGNFNTASGANALAQNTTGNDNTASGYLALQDNTAGANNTAGGYQALQSNTTGSGNTASGAGALQRNTTGGANTANGADALATNATGGDNTANGAGALEYNTTGHDNTASGVGALQDNTTGSNNTASGDGTLQGNTTGIDNTASGSGALSYNSTVTANTASGYKTWATPAAA